jgi:methyl-accepting chemotaxis protein
MCYEWDHMFTQRQTFDRSRLVRCSAVALLLVVLEPARAEAAPLSVSEGWTYQWGDSPVGVDGRLAWTGAETPAGFAPVAALAMPPGRRDEDILWLRIPLPPFALRDPSLRIDGVANAAELYLDGALVGSLGAVHPGAIETLGGFGPQFVSLPAEARGGVVAVRVQSHANVVGLQNGFFLGERADLIRATLEHGLASAFLGAASLVLGLFALLLLLQRRRERAFAAFAAFAASTGVLLMLLSQLPPLIFGAHRIMQRLAFTSGAVFGPCLIFFVATMFPAVAPRAMKVITRGSWLVAALVSFVVLIALEKQHIMLLPLLVTTTVDIGAALVVTVVLSLRGDREARLLVAGMLAMFVLVVHDALVSTHAISSTTYFIHWGVAAMTASFAALVGRRLGALYGELAARAKDLEFRQVDMEASGRRMHEGATQLTVAVSQLRATSARHNQELSHQAATLQETQVTAEEIRQGSLLAAERAKSLLAATVNADESAKRGGDALLASIAEVEQIGIEVQAMAAQMAALDQRTREIAGVVETVKGLADQSNMLALNAAIEAVRSGEHGKGFSVVAREVRSLADQSIRATERIRSILGSVETGIKEAAARGERGVERVKAGVAQVRRSGEELKTLSDIARETGGSVRQISAAVGQQNAGIAQIFSAVNDLSDQMRGTLTRLEETESAAKSVHEVAELLAATG